MSYNPPDGSTQFSAYMPIYVSAAAGTHTITVNEVDDLLFYSLDGADFTELTLNGSATITFTSDGVAPHRLALIYSNTTPTQASLLMDIPADVSLWYAENSESFIGNLGNVFPALSTINGLKSGVAGFYFIDRTINSASPIPSYDWKFKSDQKINFFSQTNPSAPPDKPGRNWPTTFFPVSSFFTLPISDQNAAAAPFAIQAVYDPYSSYGPNPLSISYSIVSGPATISGNIITVIGVGSVVVQAATPPSTFDINQRVVFSQFNVKYASQTISFPSIQNVSPGNPPFYLNASASSGLPVTFSVISGPATVSGNLLSLNGISGTVVVGANQAGNGTYAAALQTTQSFQVAYASQTISFEPIPDHAPGDSPIVVLATASSGLPVTISVVSGPATVSGGLVTFTGIGTVVLAANQAGNGIYAAAPQVTQSFNVGLLSQNISFDHPIDVFVNQLPFSVAATASSGLPVTVSILSGPASIANNLVTLTGSPGTVVYQLTQSGSSNYSAVSLTAQTIVYPIAVKITLENLAATYDGSSHAVSVTTVPAGLSTMVTYNNSTTLPVNAGSYNVTATVTAAGYSGSANAVLRISKARASIYFSGSSDVVYDGSSHGLTVSTTPSGLSNSVTYNGSLTAPSAGGSYNVVATITDPNYQGIGRSSLVIEGQPFYFSGGSASNLSNWWKDSGRTQQATSFPDATSTVYIDGAVNAGTIACNHLIVGKFSSSPIALDESWLGVPNPNSYWPSTWEFYNNSSVSPQIGGDLGLNGTSSVIVHYPNSVPFNSLESITSYVGFPYIIQAGNLSIPYGTLSIDASTHGSVAWSAVQNLKEGDDWIFFIQFHSGTSLIDPQITQLSCSFNDAVTGETVFDSSEFIPCIFLSQDGSGNTINQDGYLMHVVVESPTLQKLLGSYKDGVVASVPLLGEIQWKEVNNTQVGPNLLTQRSQNFQVTVSRSLNAPADFLT